ncbi:unnamed protein product, partial [Phaeothamnion confervicola]
MAALRRFVFLGAPGAGKGTFASILSLKLAIAKIGSGDLIREEVKAATTLGREFRRYSETGALAPDELVTTMVLQRLAEPDAAAGFIL